MFQIFIRRPVLSLVLSLIIVLLGLLALTRLPVSQFPEIVPPSVTVTARYTGANAEVSTRAVAMPLEKAINGVPGMTYMTTVTSNDGLTTIQVFFKVGTDPDKAAVSVQNRVSTVLDELPEEVIKAGVTTEKEVNSMLMYLNLTTNDSTANEKFIYNFADINILKELKRIEGVGRAEIMGQQEYAMRVWLKPDRMLAYNVSTEEAISALRAQNVEAAPGKAGESSGSAAHMTVQYVLRYTGKFSRPGQFADIPLRAQPDGSVLRLKDIADVEFGSMTYSMISETNGRPSASIMIKQRPGSNAREVIERIKSRMAELRSSRFPPGMTYSMAYDVSRFLHASIHEVLRTLTEAFLLVFVIVFLFLQDWRSTLIPALAVPVALIGTLAFMLLLGFSINLLTLFALVLAIGIVVDNAIVVVEAVHVKMTTQHLPPLEATIAAMKEIGGAIVAITLVMSAVFVPVAFMDGPVGVFYRQFSLTLACAIVISGINALTLTPALCALLMKHPGNNHSKRWSKRFFDAFNYRYEKLSGRYRSLLLRIAGRRGLTIGMLLVFFLLTWGSAAMLPTSFIPLEDQGVLYVNVTTPPGATLERTREVVSEVTRVANQQEGVEDVTSLSGYSLINEIAGSSYGMVMVSLRPWDERSESVQEIVSALKDRLTYLKDAEIDIFPPPTVPGFGNTGGFELRLLNTGEGSDLKEMSDITGRFVAALRAAPEIKSAFTSFDVSFPQYVVHIDQDIAAKRGVSASAAMSELQTLIGSYYATNFIRFDQMYKVMIQAAPGYRTKPEDILDLYIKNTRGEMVPYSSFVTLESTTGPEQISRYNMYNAAMINGEPAPGYSSGDAIAAVERIAAGSLPSSYEYEWSGMTREEIASGNQTIFVFLICLVFVYLLLAAQYESFLLPLSVLLSLPAGVFGAFLSLKLAGLENNIYAQVALVMLIGLLGKNAILSIEIAEQQRKAGTGLLRAAVSGAVSRLRPILMTSFAFIAGLIPLVVANGAGAMGNRSIGTAAAGGMLVGTLLGIVVIPGLYIVFAGLGKSRTAKKAVATPSDALTIKTESK